VIAIFNLVSDNSRFMANVRWLLLALGLSAPMEGRAADCISTRDNYDSSGRETVDVSMATDSDIRKFCGPLQVIVRERVNDPRPNVRILAVYLEFDRPQLAADQVYNEIIHRWVDRIDFDVPVNIGPDQKYEQILRISSFYRSARLISATYSQWLCCGAHGIGGSTAINVDLDRNALLVPKDLFHLGAVANFCWEQFDRIGDDQYFRRSLSRERDFADGDFEGDKVWERFGGGSLGTFAATLPNSERWSFTDAGAVLSFGPLLGYLGQFSCQLKNADLRRMVRSGVQTPP
jgi:hypothetical protein